ncbi:unnamed protein product [Orchesella dallaii]|uniref:Phospholipid scramblase n=1 Tax=Orchesella dallaii TaxID=48710 RepID=A0ABP1QM67_9HEXA
MGDQVVDVVSEQPKPKLSKQKSKSHHSHHPHHDQVVPPPEPQPTFFYLPVPPGLEYLVNNNGLIIEQQIEWGEGQRLYFAAENSDAVNIYFLGRCRPWNIIVLDLAGNTVLQGHRTSSCCFYGLCDNEVTVMSGDGFVLGSITQKTTCCSAAFNIKDSEGNNVLLVEGPPCSICCPSSATCFEAEFPIKTIESEDKIGRITKKFSGYVKEFHTEADTFCVDYPPDLHVNIKAVLIYATFMIVSFDAGQLLY